MEEHDKLVAALREVLVDTDPNSSLLLIKRVPFICADIIEMKNNLSWHRWLLVGIAVGIGVLALKSLGATF